MLTHLTVRNLALVREIKLDPGPGLNVITGETGAGKSMLIGAFAFVLGDRIQSTSGNDNQTEVLARLTHHGESIEIRRVYYANGRTKAWLNQSPVSLGKLKGEVVSLVDLTAQREGISLLDPSTHIHHLDRIGNLTSLVRHAEKLYYEWQQQIHELRALEAQLQRLQETEELAQFQLDELERFDPQPGEESTLDREITLLEHSETLLQEYHRAVEELDQGEGAVADRLSEINRSLQRLTGIDPNLPEIVEKLEESAASIRDAAYELNAAREAIYLDEEKLEKLRERRMQLAHLIRKYGGTYEDLLATRIKLRERSTGTGELKTRIRALKTALESHLLKWGKHLEKLSRERHNFADQFIAMMIDGLKTIGIEHPRFEILWSTLSSEEVSFPEAGNRFVSPLGWDFPVFHVSFNPGQPLMPIQEVASGGELSRVMLLLKSLHPGKMDAPVSIFDEIDTGISGRTARQVGKRLKELSRQRQIILVTHLPQIAGLADHHFVVEKRIRKDSTEVEVHSVKIGSDEQVEEIARLVGGEIVTDSARETARELIGLE